MVKTLYNDEMQLAGWSETHSGGAKVTFWLPSPEALDAFRTMTTRKGNVAGQRLAVCIVEIDDDGQPATAPATAPATPTKSEREGPVGGPLAKLAGMWCNDPRFIDWLHTRAGPGAVLDTDAPVGASRSEIAAGHIRAKCGVTSRAFLDSDPMAKKLFDFHFRTPYQRFLGAGI